MASFNASLTFLLMCLAVCYALDMPIIDDSVNPSGESEVRALFEAWLVKHGINYNAIGEKEKRFKIFKDNLEFITKENSKGHTYTLGLNNFADLTHEEYINMYGRGIIPELAAPLTNHTSSNDPYAFQVGDDLPDSFDWRDKGAVTEVVYQGRYCGSCWAWAVAGAIEGINKAVTGELVHVSVQEQVDCVDTCLGCTGGWPFRSLEWILHNGGVALAEDYPYLGYKGRCNGNIVKNNKNVTISFYVHEYNYNEKSIAQAVANTAPVAVAVDTHDRSWQLYSTGIYNGNCGTSLNHAVLIVGYGTKDGQDYWILKNTWSRNWGESGYMRIQRGVRKCGINKDISYPTKNAKKIDLDGVKSSY